MMEDISASALKNPWVRAWIAMVVIVLVANFTMIHLAVKSSPGLVVDNYYEKGRDYENTLKEREEEKKLLWQAQFAIPSIIEAGSPFTLTANISGEETFPEKAKLYLFRPSDASADFYVEMELSASGIFKAHITLPYPGRWDLILSLSKGDSSKEIPYKIFAEKQKNKL